ncbi:indolepyruvate oxidoreductase subunit beta family protein [Paracoccus saliphilus]|uniref:Indolepyruvate ferredoxin oxidoreductase beta subunit n=1 Tax=Paracoccus saliphilus TaxID=405559 RepID=A0AA45W5U9_9RHOB|nr:indolepyruvate oxidoreductase subunit beta family protein [Paracoccus saliphilus]WCR05607.1 indolepyruvate oxidoreductase subunit beta family protein [Paracoccus saliphilus]SIS96208.1 indolepyruvate ferredoxin oxidoreductase beta subunit [Paracoccus saliphilus]
MTLHQHLPSAPADPRLDGIIKLAILAVGGQGGGVLTNWIEALARRNGYVAQATSVAGVAQRTGATVYYIEMAPQADAAQVFALAPSTGDVDIMIAAEMMEAGRSIQRGFVTPDRTVLIASTHRALAVSEKMVPGDGIASSEEVIAAAEIAARQFISADFDQMAINNGSVISASLFGALAGSGALPFPREAFEDAIRAGGKGVEGSLRAFAAAYDYARAPAEESTSTEPGTVTAPRPSGPARLVTQWRELEARATALPAQVTEMALPGLRKVVEFQDLAYGREYLDRLDEVLTQDDAEHDFMLTREAAKYIANAMAYDDVIRVADLKTRSSRMTRIQAEMRAGEDNLMQVTEYMHPRAEEIAGMLPAGLGQKAMDSPKWMKRLDRWFNKGRRLRSDSLRGYVMLHMLGGLKGWRRRTLRHAQEQAHLADWLSRAMDYRAANYDLAVELVRCRRLVKGYSDTHARGLSKFDLVLEGIATVAARPDAADWARRLREAALQDEEGKALEGAIGTIRSFA